MPYVGNRLAQIALGNLIPITPQRFQLTLSGHATRLRVTARTARQRSLMHLGGVTGGQVGSFARRRRACAPASRAFSANSKEASECSRA